VRVERPVGLRRTRHPPIAWLVTNGHRRLRHRGVDRNRLAFSTRAAVVNLKRPINLGLEHDGEIWHLAPT